MIIYSNNEYIGYKDGMKVGRQGIHNKHTVEEASTSTLSSANIRYLKQLGFKLKRLHKNLKKC